jgi:hypothetical protein
MIDVIFLVKDKNCCHVYDPPRASKLGPEARPPATAVYYMQSIGVRAISQWAWYLGLARPMSLPG